MSATYTKAGGPRLTEFLDALLVATRWIGGHHVVWQTGQQNAADGVGKENHTHCSAFVAAVALMLDIYILRPPYFAQEELANAQAQWLAAAKSFDGPTAAATGWSFLGATGDAGALEAATTAAAAGMLVLAIYEASKGSGHVCIVRPQAQDTPMDDSGPDVVSVGERNDLHMSMKQAFADHEDAWPSNIKLYACKTDLQADAAKGIA